MLGRKRIAEGMAPNRVSLRRGGATALLVLGMLVGTAGIATATTYNRSYDGCTWYLKTDRVRIYYPVWHDSSESRTQDVNGGCHYVTAKTREPDGSNVHVNGPSTTSYVIAYDDDGGARQGYGKITTWEHGWSQYVGWVNIS